MFNTINSTNTKKNLYSNILKILFKKHKISLFILIVLPFFNALFNNYFFTKYIGLTTSAVLKNNILEGKKYILYVIEMILILQLLRFAERKTLGNFLIIINKTIKEKTMDQFLSLKLGRTNSNYDKVNRLSEKTIETIQMVFFLVYKRCCSMIIAIAALIAIDKNLGKIFILFIIIYFFVLLFITKAIAASSKPLEKQQLDNSMFLSDISRNYFFEQLFNLYYFTSDIFKKYIAQENKFIHKKYVSLNKGALVANLLSAFTCCLLLFYTIVSDVSGVEKVATLVLLNRFFSDMNDIPDILLSLINNINGIRENYTIFNEEINKRKELVNTAIFRVQLQGISYYYKQDQEINNSNSDNKNNAIFNKFSYDFTKGLYIIRGNSGSGKSTLLQIITGIRTPDEGRIIYNNIYDTNTYSLVDRISYMTQTDGIYNRTVEENISIGCNNNNNNNNNESNTYNLQVQKHIQDLSMENLMQRSTGVQGANLSGGQIRRVTFLRMLNHSQDGNLFIFDEPFVALEEMLTQKIKNFIIQTAKNNIVIVVDHMGTFSKNEGIYIDLNNLN